MYDLHNESLWLHNDLHAFKMRLCTLTMTFCWSLSYHTFIIKFDCDFDSDSIWLQNDSVWPHNGIVWPHNEFTCPYNDYVWLSQWLCYYMTLTMTLCDLPNDYVSSQGLWVSSQWLCALHNNCMTSTMILCDLNNDSLWSKQWLCVPSQRGCAVFMRLPVTFTMTYVPSQWLCDLHSDFFTLTMTICALTVTYVSLSMIYDTRMNFWSK